MFARCFILLTSFFAIAVLDAQPFAGRKFPADRFDGNGDGQITREEFTGPERFFARIDRNRDGLLSQQELGAARERWRARFNPPFERRNMTFQERETSSRKRGMARKGRRSPRFTRFPRERPKPGDLAPDFELKTLDGKVLKLSEVVSQRPVVIEFGSYT